MEIKYYREALHNYLVLKIDGDDTGSYQYKMLEHNNIKGIVPFTIRRIDGETAMYYEIDSKQSLGNMYSRRRISYENLKKLLKSVVEVTEEISRFFLDDNHLMLTEECIFEDFSTGSFHFLYNPDYDNSNGVSFFASLLEMIDIGDQKAMELIYELCDRVKPDGPCFSLIINDILRSKEDMESLDDCNNEPIASETNEIDEDTDDEEETDVKTKVIPIKLPFGVSMLMAALFAIVGGVLWYIRAAYILTYEENLLDIAVFMICVMMSLICFIQTLKASKVAGPIIRKRKRSSSDDEYEDDEDAEKDEEKEETKDEIRRPAPEAVPSFFYSEEDENEETVLLNFSFSKNPHKLYSEDDGIQNISLSSLPIVIGKLSSCADAVIKDPTVSRIHAKIFSFGDEIMIQDLNSKNGTFINGTQLLPNEKRTIEVDDEIVFGKCAFSFR